MLDRATSVTTTFTAIFFVLAVTGISAADCPAQGTGGAATTADPATGYEAWYTAFMEAEPDPSRVATIEQPFMIRRPGMQLTLLEGQVALVEVAGRTVGAAFSGDGSFTLGPSFPVERAQLKRVMGAEVYTAPIEAAVLFFADTTLAELESHLDFGEGAVERATRGVVKDGVGYLGRTATSTRTS
jgi:hypothetical protein